MHLPPIGESMSRTDEVKDYVASNHISDDAMVKIVIDMIKTSLVARASGKNIKEFPRGTIVFESNMLLFLAQYKTTNAVQFLQSMCLSTNKINRNSAIFGYIHNAKLDALPMLKKCVNSDLLSESDLYTIYKDFAYEIGQAEAGKHDVKQVEESKAFLLERAQEEKMGNAQNQLDEILCGMFPDYRTSVQREKVAEYFQKNGDDYYKKQFTKIHEAILKAPKDKRKDFRAKGELLDPERKKNKPDVQP